MPQINFSEKLKEQEESKIDFSSKLLRPELRPESQEDPSVLVKQLLGADLDTENFAAPSLRISLSRGDNLEEKNLRIRKRFPDGEVKVIPKSIGLGTKDDVLVWRESPQAQFKFVEPPGKDFTDIVEALSPSGESIAGEILMALLSRGASVPGIIARQGAGAVAGESLEQGVQELTGTQAQSLREAGKEALTEGGFSLVGGALGSPLTAGANITRGSGVLRVGEEGLETLQAANRLQTQTDVQLRDLLTPGLVTDNPLVALQEKQASVVLPALKRRYNSIVGAISDVVTKLQPKNMANASDGVLNGIRRLGRDTIRKLGVSNRSAREGGISIQQGIAEYDLVAKRIVDDLYNLARKIEDPQFNMEGLEAVMRDLELGSKGKLDPAVKRLIDEVRAINGPIQLSDRVLSVSEQLRNARTGAFAAKSVKPGEVANQATGQATDLFKALGEALDNPLNASPEFAKAWRSAASAASDRFDTLGQAIIIRASREEAPEQLVRRLVKPFNASNLQTLRSTIEPAKWKEFQEAAYSQLLRDPSKVSKTLDAFDQETLDVLMPRREQALWRQAGKEMDRINALGIERRAIQQVTNQNTVRNLVETATPNTVLTLRKTIANTRDRGLRDSVRAAIIDWAWDGIVTHSGTTAKINRNAFNSKIAKLSKSGMLNILSPSQRKALIDIDSVSKALIGGTADAGTSIRGAEIAAGVPKLKPSALIGLLQSGLISNFYLSSAGRRILIGKGIENSRGEFIRVFTAALARVSQQEDISEFAQEQP